jgi:glycerol-3-phosphate cytidylyltransferase
MKKYNKCYIGGSYNPIHYGHISLILRAKELCNIIVIGLDSDENIEYKGKELFQDFETRKKFVETLKDVNMVVKQGLGNDKVYWIKSLGIDAMVVGDDRKGNYTDGEKASKECNIPIEYLNHTPDIHSSFIRKYEKSNLSNNNIPA